MVYKYFVIHDVAVPPGLAACAAHKQGKFAEMKHLIWEKGFEAHDLSPENMKKLAGEAKLDLARFQKDMDSDECKQWLAESQSELSAVGTSGTPAFYINGRFLSGAQPLEIFSQLVEEEKAKADKAIAGGVPLESYYRSAVIEQGKKAL